MGKKREKTNDTGLLQDLIGLGNTSGRKSYYPELQRKIEELKEEKNKYERIFEDALSGIFQAELNGRILVANKSIAELSGYDSHEEFLTIEDISTQLFNDPDEYSNIIETLREQGSIIAYETDLKKKDGNLISISMNASLRKGSDREYFECFIQDITERKKVEDDLKRAHKQIQNIMDCATLASIISTTAEGVITVFNSGAERMLGYKAEEVVGKHTPELIHLESETVQRGKELTEEYGVPVEGFQVYIRKAGDIGYEEREWTYVKKDGTHIKVNLGVTALVDHDNKITGYLGLAMDVTEKKAAVEALLKSEARYRTLFEKSTDAILIIQGDKFVDCNQATVEMLRYSNKEELLDTHPSVLSPSHQPDGRQSFEKANEMIETAFRNGSHRFEWDHMKQDGEVFPVEVLLTVIPEGDQQLLHVVWRDITERKRAESELKKHQEDLEELVKSRTIDLKRAQESALTNAHKAGMSEIASGVLHHVGNILTSAITSSRVIDRKIKNSNLGKIKKCCEILEENLDKLTSFFDTDQGLKLIQYLFLSTKELELEFNEIIENRNRLEEKIHAISKVVAMQKSYAESDSGIIEPLDPVKIIDNILENQLTPEEYLYCKIKKEYKNTHLLMGHKIKIIHIIYTFIRNGITSTKSLPVTERIIQITVREADDAVLIEFMNSGTIIDDEKLKDIFSFDYTTESDYHGLKLHICANFMTEMGGEIYTENSEDFIGTKFILKFNNLQKKDQKTT